MKNNPFHNEEVQKLVDALKSQPSDKDRISALDGTITDLQFFYLKILTIKSLSDIIKI